MTAADRPDSLRRPAPNEPRCPQCDSPDLIFVEHTAAGRVVRCAECSRVVVLPVRK